MSVAAPLHIDPKTKTNGHHPKAVGANNHASLLTHDPLLARDSIFDSDVDFFKTPSLFETAPQTNANVPPVQAKGQNGLEPVKGSSSGGSATGIQEIAGSPVEVANKVKVEQMDVPEVSESKKEPQAEQAAGPEEFYPRSPHEDPGFIAVQTNAEEVSKHQQRHNEPQTEAAVAQASAPIASNEVLGGAQANQVETMDAQEPNDFDAEGFKVKLMERIAAMQMPETLEEADEFDKHSNINEINQAANQDVGVAQANAAGPIDAATQAEPNTDAVPEREVVELLEADLGTTPSSIAANTAMPAKRPESQVSQPLQENMGRVDNVMSENELTDDMLANSNEPSFTSALVETNNARAHTESAPQALRAQEAGTLINAQQNAENQSNTQLQNMQTDRETTIGTLVNQQNQTATQDTSERTRIASEIDAIYNTAKTDVERILEELETKVSEKFTAAFERAKVAFERHVDKRMTAYKAERYSGLIGAGRWLKDKLLGMPKEVEKFFVEGRQVFIDHMDKELTAISLFVAKQLNSAKDRIAQGRQEVTDYVTELPENLQSIGQEAAVAIQDQFDSLQDSVNEKQDTLIESLAQQYSSALEEVDARIEEMKAENSGLIDAVMGAIMGVIETIINIKNMLLNLLAKAISAIGTIISDPIGFLTNFFAGIKMGFEQFGTNILKHLQAGFLSWLTGAMSGINLQMPDDIFSLKGIFSLASQILGFTWDRVRAIGVKVIGEPIIKALEIGFDIVMILKNEGIAGLWEYIKDQFNDLKETVMNAIMDMIQSQVIQAGIKWILGLLSPVGAFIKACMAIIDVVVFFVQKAKQIMELIDAFLDSILAVASGSIGAVANLIENALARTVPVLIGFLASLLGLSGLAAKVTKIFQKIQQRVEKAVTKLWVKLKEMGKKVLKMLGFGKEEEEVEEKDEEKGDLSAVNEPFDTKSGEHHLIYLKRDNTGKLDIIIESTPTVYQDFINSHYIKITNPTEEITKTKNDALQLAAVIDNQLSMLTGETPITSQIEDDLDKKIDNLANLTKTLIDASNMSLIPEENIIFGGKIGGFGSSMSIMYLKSKTTGQESSNLPFEDNQVLMQRKNDSGNKYYRNGHLLNAHLHGPDDWKNLTPLSTKGNSAHLHSIESNLKGALPNSGQPEFRAFKYVVIPNYTRGINQNLITLAEDSEEDYIVENRETIIEIIKAERFVPVSLSVESVELEEVNDVWMEKTSGLNNIKDNIPNDIGTTLRDYKVTNEKVIKYPVNYRSASRQEFLDAGLGEKTVDAIMLVRKSEGGMSISDSVTLHTKILRVIQGAGRRVTQSTINKKINF